MKLNQINIFQEKNIQTEFENVYRGLNQIGFGSATTSRCENMDAYAIEITAVAGAEFSASHDLKRIPFGFITIGKNVSGDVWDGGTTNTEDAIYLRVSQNGVYKLILI